MVVAPEEGVHFVELHRFQVRNLADGRPVIRMIVGNSAASSAIGARPYGRFS